MNFTFETQGANTYLVYQLTGVDELDTLSLGMITNNKINNLAPILFTQMDEQKYLKYNISSKTSVKEFFSGIVTKNRLLGVFSSILSALLAADEYMLNPSSIMLDLENLYVDVHSNSAMLICVPLLKLTETNIDLAAFFKGIIFGLQFDPAENPEYVTRLISYLNSSPIFSLEAFKKVIDDLQYGAGSQSQKKPHVAPQSVVQPIVQPPAQQIPIIIKPVVQPSGQPQQAGAPVVQTPPVVKNIPQPVVEQQGFSIPGAAPQQPQPIAQQTNIDEKKISMFGLLMNYSKENKALYNAQKQQKKQATANVATFTSQQPINKQVKPTKQQSVQTGFAIPGQSPVSISQPSAPVQQPVAPKVPVAAVPSQQPKPVQQQQPQPQPVQQPVYTSPSPQMNFGETSVLSGAVSGETSVLNSGATENFKQPFLMRRKNNEKIILDKPVFRIGKEKSYVDYFIGDNTAISRSHANVVSHGGEYFVVDTNSTNHVFVNGSMIQKNAELKISHGDTVKLANEEFEFKLY